MRKLLLLVIVLILLGIGALAAFIATFDADRYRPMLVSKMEEALGVPVSLEHISLGWNQGLALRLQGLRVGDRASAEPLAEVKWITALVRFMPLLRREIQVASVTLVQPEVRLSRDASGRLNLAGVAALAAPAAAQGQTAQVGETPVTFAVDTLQLQDGTLRWTDAMTTPPTDLRLQMLNATVRHVSLTTPMEIEASAAYAADVPNIQLRARLTPPGADQPGTLEETHLALQMLPIDSLVPAGPAGSPRLRGHVSATLEGQLPTLRPEEIAQALTGTTRLRMDQPVIENLNVLRVVFEKLSMLPTLVERLQARLPDEYRAKLAANHTILAPLDLSAQVERGRLRFEEATLRTDEFALIGSGTAGFDGTVDIRALLRLDRPLSEAIARSVEELRALHNPAGEMEIPVTIQGRTSQLSVLPDLHYVAARVITAKVTDLITDALRKQLSPEAPAQPAPDGAAAPGTEPGAAPAAEEPSPGELLGQFLGGVLRGGQDAPSE